MKNKKKKAVSFLLASLMIAAAITGCSSVANGNGSVPESSAASSSDTAGSSESSESAPAERRTLTVEIFDRSTAGLVADDNISTRYVQEHFGEPNQVDVDYIPVPRAQERDMLNTLMAANNAPDMCFTYYGDLVYNYVKNGGIWDLTDALASNGKELSEFLGDTVLEYGVYDGKQYAIPAKRMDSGALTTFVRKDWLEKLGLAEPTTTEEFYQMLTAFKEQDPGGFGSGTIPFGLNYSAVDITWSSANLLDSFKEDMTDEELATLPEFAMPGFKEGMRELNKWYNEGLVSPNFALDKDTSQYKKDIAAGKMGSLTNNFDFIYSSGNGYLADELAKNVEGGQYTAVDPFNNAEGKHPKRLYTPNGIFMFVPKTCEDPTLVIDYLNWMTDDDVRWFLQYGEEGIHYDSVDENGLPVGRKTNEQLPEGQILGEVFMILNGQDFGDPEVNKIATASNYPGHEEELIKSLEMATVDGWLRPRLEAPIESEATLGATVQDKANELFVKSVTCTPDQFDATFDSLLAEYMEIGGQEILDEKIQVWQNQTK